MNDHEEAFVRRFIIDEKQQRYLGFLATPTNRRKFLREFYHRLAIKFSLAEEVVSKERTVKKVEQRLLDKGAPSEVYMISPASDVDQRRMALADALRIVIDDCTEAVLCCIPGELAFYRSETNAWILFYDKRKGSTKV